jgi:hypothetical protein
MANIELIKYCSFGYRCPVAILAFDGGRQIYTIEGVNSLVDIHSENHSLSLKLKNILGHLRALEYQEIKELSWDDISGQEKLF